MGRYDIALGRAGDKTTKKQTPVGKGRIDPTGVHFLLNRYLFEDINRIICQPGCDAVVFGGAVRDCIAFCPHYVTGMDYDNERDFIEDVDFIHDVDIMALPRSAKLIEKYLINAAFDKVSLASPDLIGMYTGIKKIHEPWTFVKGGGGKRVRIIQIIRPTAPENRGQGFHTAVEAINIMDSLLGQVDISACGVVYDGNHIVETYPNAIEDCLQKRFEVIENNAMYQRNRIYGRIEKLETRGWHQK